MSQFERIYKLDRLLRRRVPPDQAALLSGLEVSLATLKRDLEFMRSRLGAPIVWDREARGYRYDRTPEGEVFHLPGLWFSAGEIHALLLLRHIVGQLEPGLLRETLRPFERRLNELGNGCGGGKAPLSDRLRILSTGVRTLNSKLFEAVASATVLRRRLQICYFTRGRGETGERQISPWRLLYYRGNWYLDAWCHTREGTRRFALDALRAARLVDEPAHEPAEGALEESGYGVFRGRADKIAILCFRPVAARWVAAELWHPRQKAELARDGSMRLEVPYSHSKELLMDILRHGDQVEVESPAELRRAVRDALVRALERYETPRRSMPAVPRARAAAG